MNAPTGRWRSRWIRKIKLVFRRHDPASERQVSVPLYYYTDKLMFSAVCSHLTESLPLEGKVLSVCETDEV